MLLSMQVILGTRLQTLCRVNNLKYEILPADLLLPANPVLGRGNQIATICGTTGNYRLSFDINPRSVIAAWGSIINSFYL